MKVLILGNDIAYQKVEKYFKERNAEVDWIKGNTFIDVVQYDCIFFPIKGVSKNYVVGDTILSPEFLMRSKESVLLFSGKETPYLSELLERGNRTCEYFLENPSISLLKDQLMGEEILKTILLECPAPIHESSIALVGQSRVLSRISLVLQTMGAKVTSFIEEDPSVPFLFDSIVVLENNICKVEVGDKIQKRKIEENPSKKLSLGNALVDQIKSTLKNH